MQMNVDTVMPWKRTETFRVILTRSVIVLAMASWFAGAAFAQSAAPKPFMSPQAAVTAFYNAVKLNDRKEALAILGPSVEEWLLTGDTVADRNAAKRFVAAYEQKHGLEMQGNAKAILTVGNDDFPFAFAIIRREALWRFDPEGGKEELLARRIGENELNAIEVLLAIVDAQFEYASLGVGKTGASQYARQFASSPGKRDGLHWPVTKGEKASPLGSLIANAVAEGYRRSTENKPVPYHGYYYRMLLSQGPGAPDGPMDYVVNDRMIGGFAVIAYPAKYRVSGIISFMVSHDGTIYEADLGPESATNAKDIRIFNPASSWRAYVEK